MAEGGRGQTGATAASWWGGAVLEPPERLAGLCFWNVLHCLLYFSFLPVVNSVALESGTDW